MDGILFLFLAVFTIIASVKIANYANVMDNKTNISGSFIGGIFLASVTSLPEFVTCLTATFINNPYLAIGDILGSNIFNIFILAIFDIIFVTKMFFKKVSHRYFYINALLVYIYVVLINSFINKDTGAFFNVGLPTIVIIIFYFIYTLFLSKINDKNDVVEVKTEVRNIKIKFFIASILMIGLSICLIFCADYIAFHHPEVSSSVIGAFLIGITTSLPEVVSVYTLLRINNFNLAFASIIGSNIFNLLILAIADICYRDGSIYFFSDNQNLLIAKVNLYIGLIVFIYLMRKRITNKFIYLLPSIAIVFIYLYLWKLLMIR